MSNIEPDTRQGGLDKQSESASVGGNQVDKLLLVLEKLISKKKPVKEFNYGRYGAEYDAVHVKDIDHEYWKLTGESLL